MTDAFDRPGTGRQTGCESRHVASGAAAPAASLVVCSTCRLSADLHTDAAGRNGGELFLQALTAALAVHGCRGRIELVGMPCLFACGSHCTVAIQSAGRMAYLLGRFTPAAADAISLLDYAARYLDTADGSVPFDRWPEGVKGHFVARLPPLTPGE